MAGPQCCIPAPPSEHAYTGGEGPFAHMNSYTISLPSPNGAVILASDIFGFTTPLLRKLADKISGAGYFVVVPDYFDNDPFTPTDSEDPFAALPGWVEKHRPAKGVEDTKKVIEVLKSKGFTSIGATGFCWGAKVVVELAKEDYLKAAVLCHPAWVTVDDLKDVKVPISILAAELDHLTPPEVVEEFAAILDSKKEVESFVKIYPGVEHGWTVRYDVKDKKAVKNAEDSHEKMLEWFEKFVR